MEIPDVEFCIVFKSNTIHFNGDYFSSVNSFERDRLQLISYLMHTDTAYHSELNIG